MSKKLLTVFATVCLAASASGSASARGTSGPLKMCGYMTRDGGTYIENIKIVDQQAAGSKITAVFTGTYAKSSKQLLLSKSGVVLTSFTVTRPATETIAVTVTKPSVSQGVFHFSLHAIPGGNAAPNGCTPR